MQSTERNGEMSRVSCPSPVAIWEEASEMNIILEVCCSVFCCHAGMVQFSARWIKGEK